MADEDQTVPYARFSAVVAEKQTLTSRVQELEAKLAPLGEAANRLGRVEEDLALARAGLADPEAADVARMLWSRTPEESRPPLAEWVRGALGDPAAAPRALRPYLPQAPAPAAAPVAPAAPPAQAPVPAAAGATSPPPPGSPRYTPEQIRALRESGQYAQHREAILAQMGGRK